MQPTVAILLATYNGAQFVARQLESFKENRTPFTVHWLDDQSTDETRSVVKDAARSHTISLVEWHENRRQGVPGAFFRLLEHVAADIYLFSDQDDIWECGKIDVTVANLLPDLGSSVLCFSEPLMFRDDNLHDFRHLFEVLGAKAHTALEESRLFMGLALGHCQGFTRGVRDIFLSHQAVARQYAFMHDLWMYDIAMASGGVRLLTGAPTTLYRIHSTNTSGAFGSWRGRRIQRVAVNWNQHQRYRLALSRHAQGFILASNTLPTSAKLVRLVAIAGLVARLHERHSPTALLRLIRERIIWPAPRLALGLSLVCLCSRAESR